MRLGFGVPRGLVGDRDVARLPHDEPQLELLLDRRGELDHRLRDGELVLEDLDAQHDAPLRRRRARVGEGARLLGQGLGLLHLLPRGREEALLEVDERAAYLGLAEDAVIPHLRVVIQGDQLHVMIQSAAHARTVHEALCIRDGALHA